MEGTKFTWFPKLTDTVAKVPEELRGSLLWALVRYGTYGEEPDLGWPLDAIFESLREDIANSKQCRSNGKSGGRGNRKAASDEAKPPFGEAETPLCKEQNPALGDAETPLCESGKGSLEDAEPKPDQTSPVQSKPEVVKRKRFKPPTPQEADAYAAEWCRENGYDPSGFAGSKFVDFYASKGWMVGRSPMKDWKAAARNWIVKDCRKGARNEYSDF